MKWTSVKDDFPLTEQEVLLFHPFKKYDGSASSIIFVGYWDSLNNEWVCDWAGMLPPIEDNFVADTIDDHMRLKKRKVTHWMPLPQPPKE